MEREGISAYFEAQFVLIGSMNPEEGPLSPQILDRFGLCVLIKGERDERLRLEILKRRLAFERDPETFVKSFSSQEEALRERVFAAQNLLPRVRVPAKLKILIGHLASEASVAGNRSEIFLLEAVKAHAAFEGREEARLEDLEKTCELVLRHRRRCREKKAHSSRPQRPKPQKKGELKKGEKEIISENKSGSFESKNNKEPVLSEEQSWSFSVSRSGLREKDEEKFFPAGKPFPIKEIFSQTVRPKMAARLGRGDRALTLLGQGHYLRAVPYQGQGEVALHATILAAARRRARKTNILNFS